MSDDAHHGTTCKLFLDIDLVRLPHHNGRIRSEVHRNLLPGSSLPVIAEVLAGVPEEPKSLTRAAALHETGTAPLVPVGPCVRPHSISSICNLNLTGPQAWF